MRPWRRLVDRQIAWVGLVNMQLATLTRMTEQLWEAVAEVRDGLVDLDHAKAPTARLNELHTELDALRDDFSVLRNDYRGEAT